MYKNTLARFAAQRAGVEALSELLVGPTAITFVAGDAAAVAKALRDVARVNPLLVIKGGAMGGKAMSGKDVEALAELPEPGGAARPVRRRAAGTARQDGRPAPGAPAQLRLRPQGPHRQQEPTPREPPDAAA